MTEVLDLRAIQDGWKKEQHPGIPAKAVEPPELSEGDRLAYRKAAKSRMAEFSLLEQDRKKAQDHCVDLDRQLDELAAKHVEDCEPLQEELRTIEEARIQETIDRKPADPAREERRSSLISTLKSMNESLQESLARVREQIPAASEALMAATIKCTGGNSIIEQNKLVSLGKPEYVDQLFVVENAVMWADRRHDAIRRKLPTFDGPVALRRARAELSAASIEVEKLRAEEQRLRNLCIDE